jgi:hypothetical protein
MSELDKAKLEDALMLVPKAVAYGKSNNWTHFYRLAQVAKVQTAFSQLEEQSDIPWWNEELMNIALDIARSSRICPSIPRSGPFMARYSDSNRYSGFHSSG